MSKFDWEKANRSGWPAPSHANLDPGRLERYDGDKLRALILARFETTEGFAHCASVSPHKLELLLSSKGQPEIRGFLRAVVGFLGIELDEIQKGAE